MKLQRKHHGEDAARNCAAAKNHGGQIWQAKLRRGSGVEVISLNKHKEDGSHNNREVQAGGDTWEQEGPFDHVDTWVVSLTR